MSQELNNSSKKAPKTKTHIIPIPDVNITDADIPVVEPTEDVSINANVEEEETGKESQDPKTQEPVINPNPIVEPVLPFEDRTIPRKR